MLKRVRIFQAVAHYPIHAGVTEQYQTRKLNGLIYKNDSQNKDADSQRLVMDEVVCCRSNLSVDEIAKHT